MNKSKLLVAICLIFSFVSFTFPLNAYARRCHKLSTQYQIFLNTNLVTEPSRYNVEIFRSRIKNYPATIVDVDIGTIFEGGVGRGFSGNCNTIGTQLPVVVIDDVGLDGDIGDTFQVDYICVGRLNRSSGITGLCKLDQFVPQFGQSLKDSATFIATPTSNQRIRTK